VDACPRDPDFGTSVVWLTRPGGRCSAAKDSRRRRLHIGAAVSPSGAEGEEGYDEAATQKLGPSSLRHHEDGSVTIEGEEVDDPEEYKGEPIPGGPSDPDAPPDPAMVGEEEDEDSSKDADSSSDEDSSERDSG